VQQEAVMADKGKEGTGKSGRKRTVVRRRRTTGGTAGRLAVRRDTAAYRRAAPDEHAVQVRDQIEAALAEARRVREDITERIDRRLKEDEDDASKLLTQLTSRARLRALHPPAPHEHGKGGKTSRSKPSK